MGGLAHASFHHKGIEERDDVVLSEHPRTAMTVKANESSNPIDVGFLSARTHVSRAHFNAEPGKEPLRSVGHECDSAPGAPSCASRVERRDGHSDRGRRFSFMSPAVRLSVPSAIAIRRAAPVRAHRRMTRLAWLQPQHSV